MFKPGDKVKFKERYYYFWDIWFRGSFKFDDVITVRSAGLGGWSGYQEISFVENRYFVAGSRMLELYCSVDKDGQMQLPFNFSRGD